MQTEIADAFTVTNSTKEGCTHLPLLSAFFFLMCFLFVCFKMPFVAFKDFDSCINMKVRSDKNASNLCRM